MLSKLRLMLGLTLAAAVVVTVTPPAPAVAASYGHEDSRCDSSSTIVEVCVWIDYNYKNTWYPSAGGGYYVDTEQYKGRVRRLDPQIALIGLQIEGHYLGQECHSSSWPIQGGFYSGWVQYPSSGTVYYYGSPWSGHYTLVSSPVTYQTALVNVQWKRGTATYTTSVRLSVVPAGVGQSNC